MNFLTRSRGKRVGSTEHDSTSLDGVKTFPDHADNRAGHHCGTSVQTQRDQANQLTVLNETREEGLLGEVRVVLLEVFLQSSKTIIKIGPLDRGKGDFTLEGVWSLRATSLKPRFSNRPIISPTRPRWTPSGLKRSKHITNEHCKGGKGEITIQHKS